MNKETKGTILALLTALISGFAVFANKFFVIGTDPTVFTSLRALIIGIAFLCIMYWQSGFKADELRKSFSKANWRYMLAIAVIGGAAAFLLFFTGLQLTTAGRAAFLHKTLPIYVAVFAYWFLHEKISMKQTYALIIMMLGTVVMFGSAIEPAELWTSPLAGDLLVLLATVLWAAENTIARKAMIKGDTNWIVSFSRMFIGALILFGFAGVMGKLGLLLALAPQQVMNISISAAILFGYIFTWYYSIKLINVSKASAILLLAPVVSLALGAAFLGEPAQIVQLAGSALILIGAYFVVNIRSELAGGV
ncbi:MAG: DMT family transporter [Candidatus Aenigmarchaeota archaeon]|nr:DMT family transporter [Candidatus Aenigmarchaeota archaeon]